MLAEPQPGETWIVDRALGLGSLLSRGRLVENVLCEGTVAWRHVGQPTVYFSPADDWRRWADKMRARRRVEAA